MDSTKIKWESDKYESMNHCLNLLKTLQNNHILTWGKWKHNGFFNQEVRKRGQKSLRKDSTSKGCWSKVLGTARKTEQENWVSVAVRGLK